MVPPHLFHVFSSFETGGPEIRTVGIINALGSQFRHTIMAADGRAGARHRLAANVTATVLPPPPGKGKLTYALAFRSVLRQLGPSVVATYNWGAIDAVLGARLASIPVIHAEDGFGPEEADGLMTRRRLARRLLLRKAFATVVPSRTLLNIALNEYKLPSSRVRLIPNGVDLHRFRPGNTREWRRVVGVPDEVILAGFVGALRPEKRLDHLLRAVARCRGEHLRVAIVGEGPCRAELETLARQLAIGDRVIFTGEVTDTALAYSAFDLFVMSSSTEQQPISLLEAMASGLPALCTDVGDCRIMLDDASGSVTVMRDDLDAYADVLERLVADQPWRVALGRRNRQRCEANFSHQRMLREYAALYTEAASSGAGSADGR